MKETIDRKYVLALAAVAFGILVIGSALRPRKELPQPPSPSETARLQELVRREDFRRMANYLAERAGAVSQYVIYISDRESSAVAWEGDGQVLTTGRDVPLTTVKTTLPQPRPPTSDAGMTGHWVVIVGRSPDEQRIWTGALVAGQQTASCDGLPYGELLVNAPISSTFRGAGVFSLDGELTGIVIRCEEETHIASIRSAKELLAAVTAPVERLRREHGIQTSATEQGLRITELTIGGRADRMGLRAGDDIQASSVEQLQGILADLGASLSIMRSGRKLSVPVEAKEPGLGIAVRSEPSAVLTIAPDTPAFRAGLRTGDRLVSPTPVQMRRAELPLTVVYERGAKQYATVIDK